MTEPVEPPTPQPPAPAPPDPGGINPRPGVLALAILLTVVMLTNIYLDSQSDTYDGKFVTPVIAALIAGVLGFDITRFFKGGGGTP